MKLLKTTLSSQLMSASSISDEDSQQQKITSGKIRRRCTNCNQPGHDRRNCTKSRFADDGSVMTAKRLCTVCRSATHDRRTCPALLALKNTITSPLAVPLTPASATAATLQGLTLGAAAAGAEAAAAAMANNTPSPQPLDWATPAVTIAPPPVGTAAKRVSSHPIGIPTTPSSAVAARVPFSPNNWNDAVGGLYSASAPAATSSLAAMAGGPGGPDRDEAADLIIGLSWTQQGGVDVCKTSSGASSVPPKGFEEFRSTTAVAAGGGSVDFGGNVTVGFHL
jgi:hypothetical protein